jgi:hypothetical protein
MLQRALIFMAVLWLAGSARADDAVECDGQRDGCDAQILELCPAGADVLDEKEVPGPSPAARRYRIVFRCRGAAAAPAPAPAPAPVPGAEPAAAPAPAPAGSASQDELASVNLQLAELRAERRRYGLVGPLVLLGAGTVSSAIFVAVALAARSNAETLDDGGIALVDEDGDGDWDDVADEEDYRETARLAGGLAVVGAGVAVGGGVWLWLRLKKRNAHKDEIEQLEARQRQLSRFGVSIDPIARSFALRASF